MNRIFLRKFVRCALTGAVALTFGTMSLPTMPVLAAPSSNSAPSFGSVDVQKILAGYSKKSALDAQIQDMNQRLDAQFKQQVNSPMLNKDQQAALGALLSKSNPTDADRAQITALQAQSNKDSDELASLQQKKDPTADDKTRLDVLTKQLQAGQQTLQDMANSYREQVQAQNDKLSAQLSESVKAAIVATAQQRGLSVVFDAQVAIYTANDITDDVLKRLNK